MKLSTIFKTGVALLLIPAIYNAFFPGKIVIITALCLYPLLFFLLLKIKNIKKNEFQDKGVILAYIILSIITFIRGIFDSKSQQDFTVLLSVTIFLMLLYPLFIFLAQRKYVTSVFNALIFVALPLSFVTFFFPPSDGFMSFQHNMSFIYLFVFFIPFVKLKWKIIILLLCIIVPLYDITRRSSLINITVCLSIILTYYTIPRFIYRKMAKVMFFILILSPVFLLILGLSGVYNIFTLGDSFDEVILSSKTSERNILVDSRTAIYTDVFSELSRQNAYLFGLGGVGKTKTSLSEDSGYYKIYKEGRRGTESGMLNFFQWGGIIGAFSYWLLLVVASYKAIFKSNNSLFIMLGLFIAFKVLYSFVEDRLQTNAATFYLMFYIGLCYNLKLRSLTDFQMKKVSYLLFR